MRMAALTFCSGFKALLAVARVPYTHDLSTAGPWLAQSPLARALSATGRAPGSPGSAEG